MAGREFTARTIRWMDEFWDEDAGLLGYPSTRGSRTNPYQQPGVAVVRETATYAVALLERDEPGDRARAERALGALLAHQIDEPGTVAHGTWRRSPAEPEPGPEPREWIDYDPNWREFVGTALALALGREGRLPQATVHQIEGALRIAVVGTLARAVPPDYTNIALMSAFLLDWCGERLGEPGWRRRGEELARAVWSGYREAGAFPEHNSPTYYGIDFYGLALWRERAPSARLREWGAELEEELWRDCASFYHAGLRNLCGPYTRAYGMDMTRYVASVGTWIAAVVPPDAAPLPELGPEVAHAHDLCELVFVGLLGARVPEDARAHLLGFRGARSVEQTISAQPRRVATARLREDAMWGGEQSGGRIIHWQHHPATMHWRRADASVGWLRVSSNAPVDAVAEDEGLSVSVHTGLAWLREAAVSVWLEFGPEGWCEEAEARVDIDLGPASLMAATARDGRLGWAFPAGDAPARVDFRLRLRS
jgi:hypothetical protein